ncbi:hypothetical protein [Candidatus Hakubella thermalkaliphila]|uniref:hypothetical protein n=1 Tax=Candidatus Hakubella thermalkaliphila TaxID=2754717 RepID=UPI00159312F5|nr:hypothetical protein [Candidatus Hakubella thermalkaliphila]
MEVKRKMSIRKPKEPEFMRELHRIREEMYEESKKLTPRERVNRTHKEVEEFLTSQGYRLIPSNTGYRMEFIGRC